MVSALKRAGFKRTKSTSLCNIYWGREFQYLHNGQSCNHFPGFIFFRVCYFYLLHQLDENHKKSLFGEAFGRIFGCFSSYRFQNHICIYAQKQSKSVKQSLFLPNNLTDGIKKTFFLKQKNNNIKKQTVIQKVKCTN